MRCSIFHPQLFRASSGEVGRAWNWMYEPHQKRTFSIEGIRKHGKWNCEPCKTPEQAYYPLISTMKLVHSWRCISYGARITLPKISFAKHCYSSDKNFANLNSLNGFLVSLRKGNVQKWNKKIHWSFGALPVFLYHSREDESKFDYTHLYARSYEMKGKLYDVS